MQIGLSIILCTKRQEPRFDFGLMSLYRSLDKHPVRCELIVIDGILWENEEDRRAQFQAEQRRAQQAYPAAHIERFTHRAPKPTPWQGPNRLTSRDYFALSNARNTALALANFNQVAFFDDCSILDENWIYYHSKAGEKGVALAGACKTYVNAVVDRGIILHGKEWADKDGNPSEDHRGNVTRIAPGGGWLYGWNMGFPLKAAFDTNGCDERFDGQGGSEDCEMGVRIERAGYKILYSPECKVYQIMETHTEVCGFPGHNQAATRKQKEIVLKDGQAHYANEYLVQCLMESPNHVMAPNDFMLLELWRKAHDNEPEPFKKNFDPDMKDWRDGELLRNM